MTYRDLLNKLLTVENCELEQDVTVCVAGEFYPAELRSYPATGGVLDAGHLCLVHEPEEDVD